jgi:endonuclease/exonuclease/phosphatase family metal-dependent hydrolase
MPLTLATFNVKNLLEPPEAAVGWAFLDQKIAWIVRMLAICDADVVGLQEVGGPALQARLDARLRESRAGYGAPIAGTADARGIRCAVLSRLPVVHAHVHTAGALPFPVFQQGDPPPFGQRVPLRRGILQVRVHAPQVGTLDTVVAHLKSPRPLALRDKEGRELPPNTPSERVEGTLRSLVWRAAEALEVRRIVDQRLAEDGRAHIVAMGDFNDVPDSPVLDVLQGEGGEGALLDCTSRVLAPARFSVLHMGRRLQLDHVLATEGLYSRLIDARFHAAGLREHPPPGPDGNEPPTVDSDHAPLVVRFE